MLRLFRQGDKYQDSNLFINREIKYFSSEDRHILLESQVSVIRFFEKLLIRGVEAGELRVDYPIAVAHQILVLASEWGLRRWFLSRYFTLEQYAQINIGFILKQIEADSGVIRNTSVKASFNQVSRV